MSELIDYDVLEGRVCPYCRAAPELVSSVEVYGKDYGLIWLCRPCQAWVGVHKGSELPLGRLADAKLREAKKEAHDYFDDLWMRKMEKDKVSKHEARTGAYDWLSKKMGIAKEYTHIGMFNVAQCKVVVGLCKPYVKK